MESLRLASLDERDRQDLLAFQQRAGELQRAMMGAVDEALGNIQVMKKALADMPEADPRLGDRVLVEVDLQKLGAALEAAGSP